MSKKEILLQYQLAVKESKRIANLKKGELDKKRAKRKFIKAAKKKQRK